MEIVANVRSDSFMAGGIAIRILILSCSTGGGHNAAGRAICEEMEARGVECDFTDALSLAGANLSAKVSKAYVRITTRAPEVFRLLYQAGGVVSRKNRLKRKSPIYFVNKLYAEKMRAYIQANGYDMVVMPHLFPAETLTVLKQEMYVSIKTVAVATDYTCIPFWEETAPDYFVIPHPDLVEEFASRGIPREKLVPLGIPIGRAFRQTRSREEARLRLGLRAEGTIYLFMTGSMGFGRLDQWVRAVLCRDPEGEVLVLCGSNEAMRRKLQEKFAGCPAQFLSYTQDVADYMAACDVLLTKPGGLTTTEAAAMGVPLVHTSPIPGCETMNADFFARHGMSVVAEDADTAAGRAMQLAHDAARRSQMLARQKEHIHRDACEEICDFICAFAAGDDRQPL